MFTDFFSKLKNSGHSIYPQFNYMVLTGVEYQEYSISAGFYYPIYGIWGNNKFREITSNKSSPIIRLMRTTKDLSLKLTYSQSNIQSNSPDDNRINLIQSSELMEYGIKSEASNQLINSITMYDLKAGYMRIDMNYDITKELNIGFSEVVFQGEYSEQFSGDEYELDFLHLISSLTMKQSFSDYTAVKGELNYFIRNNDYKKVDERGESNEKQISYAISIEFFL